MEKRVPQPNRQETKKPEKRGELPRAGGAPRPKASEK